MPEQETTVCCYDAARIKLIAYDAYATQFVRELRDVLAMIVRRAEHLRAVYRYCRHAGPHAL